MRRRKRLKMFGLISSLCFLLVFIGTTVAVVLAAMQQSVGTAISIKYVSKQVAGVITASYQIKNNPEVAMVDSITGDDKIVLTGAESSYNEVSLSPTDSIEFTAENNSVVFKYSFTNTGDADYVAQVSQHDGVDNLTMEISKDGENYSNINDNSMVVFNNTSEPESFYVRYTVSDLSKNIDTAIAFNWDLKSVDKETEAIVNGEEYETLDDALSSPNLYTVKSVAEGGNNDYKIVNILKDCELYSTVSVTENLVLYSQKDVVVTVDSETLFDLENGTNLLLGMPYDKASVTYECPGNVVTGSGKIEINSSNLNNMEGNSGTAVSLSGTDSSITLNAGKIQNFNVAVTLSDNAVLSINNGKIENCNQTFNGNGFILIESDEDVNIQNASLTGLGLLIKKGTVTLDNVTLSGFTKSAIDIQGGEVSVKNSIIEGCLDSAIKVNNAKLVLDNTTIQNNVISQSNASVSGDSCGVGAGIYAKKSIVNVVGNTIFKNNYISTDVVIGVAIFMDEKSTLNLGLEDAVWTGTIFDHSNSSALGVVATQGGSIVMNSGTILGGIAKYGGAVYIVNSGNFEMNGGTILNNDTIESENGDGSGDEIHM